jgi:site-specific DNA-methyltransferase (adenine-specific)
MKEIPDGSVDMILCDLPYGTTACKWDVVIPFEPLWGHYWRVIKSNGATVLFGSEPFSSLLRTSQLKYFKYDWIWQKDKSGNWALAKYQPMKTHEIISIFSKKTHYYAPIMDTRDEKNKRKNKPRVNAGQLYGGNPERFFVTDSVGESDKKYPTTIRFYNSVRNGLHPTQKPVALLEYLIKTYTNEGETVLDNCMGSGSTGVACVNTKRRFIGIEKDEKYFEITTRRLAEAHQESSQTVAKK